MGQWYINVSGQSQGPFTSEQMGEWAKSGQIKPSTQVMSASDGAWRPLAHTSLKEHIPTSRGTAVGCLWAAGAGAALLALFIIGAINKPDDVSSASESKPETLEDYDIVPAKQTPPTTEFRCAVQIPDSSGGTIPVMPTKSGYDELTRAMITGDDDAIRVTIRANSGFLVDPGTKCTWIDVGLLSTEVRIIEGPHEGRSGFLPSEWTRVPK